MTDSKSPPARTGQEAGLRVARPPERPLLIYDGDCGFCRFWVERWRHWTGGRFEVAPFQDSTLRDRFPEVGVERCERAVQLIEPDGRVTAAAEAAFQSLALHPRLAWLRWLYSRVPLFAWLSELAYAFVARHRMGFSRVTRMLCGTDPVPPRYERTTLLFVRAVALTFLVAFVSLWSQVHGLVGEQGILPAGEFMASVDGYFDRVGVGVGRYWTFPTLGWLAAGDGALHLYCLVGIVAAIVVLAGWLSATGLLSCWVMYLSLTLLGQDFLSFQWDILLLETGFLAALICPWTTRLRWPAGAGALGGILLMRWLLFRLMFESGIVKLTSGDLTWRNLTALRFHFETQPLPTWLGWHAHHLPLWLLKSATVIMYGIELVVPFLLFAPRRLRLFAGAALAFLQVVILLTGNYGFFNVLTLVLCLASLDDRAVDRIRNWGAGRLRRVPLLKKRTDRPMLPTDVAPTRRPRFRRWVVATYAIVVLAVGAAQLEEACGWSSTGEGPVNWLRRQVAPLHLVNSYGLFRVMTTRRPELVVEGSMDGVEWRAYRFKFKPGDAGRAPGFLPLHMPRLDWQFWFAALSEGNPPGWLNGFCEGLFKGSPAVLGLLEENPFAEAPPRYLRVLALNYRFTTPAERRNTGDWWVADARRYYLPIMRWDPTANDPDRR